MKNLLTHKKAVQVNAVALAFVVLFGSIVVIGYAAYKSGMFDEWTDSEGTGLTALDSNGDPVDIVPPTSIRTGTAKWAISTTTTTTATASGDTAYVGILVADENGYFNPMEYSERTEMDASPDTSANFYAAGDELLMFVTTDDDATNCDESYGQVFYIESLDHGVSIKRLPKSNPISALTEYTDSNGDFVYKVDGAKCETDNQKVNWYEAGDGSYWHFGTFKVYERNDNDDQIIQHISAGVVGATYNDGSTYEDTDAEINANYTFTGNDQKIYLQMIGEASDGAWGVPVLGVTSGGQIKQYQGVIIFATDAVDIDTQPITDGNWKQMNKPGLLNDVAFYYVPNVFAEGGVPSQGDTIDISVPIHIYDTGLTASTEYEFEAWFLDLQCVADVATGSTSASVPSANGVIADMGVDTVTQGVAVTLSSNAVATPQLMGHFTTNA